MRRDSDEEEGVAALTDGVKSSQYALFTTEKRQRSGLTCRRCFPDFFFRLSMTSTTRGSERPSFRRAETPTREMRRASWIEAEGGDRGNNQLGVEEESGGRKDSRDKEPSNKVASARQMSSGRFRSTEGGYSHADAAMRMVNVGERGDPEGREELRSSSVETNEARQSDDPAAVEVVEG